MYSELVTAAGSAAALDVYRSMYHRLFGRVSISQVHMQSPVHAITG